MKIYVLSFFCGDANFHIPNEDEVYSSIEKAQKRKKEFFEKATDEYGEGTYYKGDWFDDEHQEGIKIEEWEIH